MDSKSFGENKGRRLRSSVFGLVAVAVAIALAGTVVALYHERQSLQEQLILEQASTSVLRQDCQRMQKELDESRRQALASEEAVSAGAPEASCAQTFRGTFHVSSFQDRALEAGIPPSTFPEADVLLLRLESPQTAIGYTAGDSVASEREVALIRVPDGLGVSGESIGVEVGEPVFWASDVSGLLWDLDLSGMQSLEVSSLSVVPLEPAR